MKLTPVQVISIGLITVLIINLILLAMGKINYKVFWMILVVTFGVSYIIKKSEEKNG